MGLSPKLDEALTRLANEVSLSLRSERESHRVTLWHAQRWHRTVSALVEAVEDARENDTAIDDRVLYDVKEGILDDLGTVLFDHQQELTKREDPDGTDRR